MDERASGRRTGAARSSMADVAARAGVSKGTVSHVLNHPERVAPETRERVERAIRELSFIPHGMARSLAVGTSPAVGLVLSDVANSLFREIARGVETVVDERQAFVLLTNTYTDLAKERRYLAMFESMQTLGTIVAINNDRHFRSLVAHHRGERPLVFVDFHGDGVDRCSVHANNVEGGALAARHLVEIGRRRLAVVAAPRELQPVDERLEGFEDALAGTGASIVARAEVDGVRRSDGWLVGQEWRSRIEAGEIDGIFAMADLVAAGLAQALTAGSSLRIPEDVALIGYDDNQEAWDSPTPLTTVRQPGAAMGEEAAAMLFEEAEDPDHRHRAVGMAPSLVVRASTVGA
ncbi:LacI family DNA-binding transcriptional regulator [Demequina sp. SYSU T00068]|uniref:LacI family DNA-binding transcriptional regulator n=1 Tax=Demequina lignilytica TaxID=3051663 RepID=UPI0026195884|nr:LacI family DNA-binding transcriptional regulator [Demequina sp. SYSU T00068]MDN4490229.1 LacI family DNA-binding transcriptional regulator [Demequina sp. SYSU T00068]